MADLPQEIRAELQEASRVLRKVRATDGRTLLPLTVVNRQEASG
ncbi:hypothetical protein ACFW6X_26580 [Streptomyces bacillaris]